MKVGPREIDVPTAVAQGPLQKMLVQRDQGGERHCFHTPLSEPVWRPAERAKYMRPEDPVMGIVAGQQAYALPWWIMKNHHVANLVLDGQAIMAVLCEACAGASAYDGTVDGQRLTFQVEGKYNGTHILIDHQTGSLWTPFDGLCVHGPMLGKSLAMLQLFQCTWAEWTRLHPKSLVPAGKGEPRTGHGAGFPSPETVGPIPFGLATSLNRDERLPDQVLVFGVEAGGKARAYPLRRLEHAGPVLNDSLGGLDIAVFSKPGSWLACAYDRHVDGKLLNFTALEKGGHARDGETGSVWNVAGKAVAGPLQGKSLRFLRSGVEKWFGWSTSHPGTDIFTADVPPERRKRASLRKTLARKAARPKKVKPAAG